MTARDEVLDAARALAAVSADGTFTPVDVVGYLQSRGTRYAPSTIRTHVISRMCTNAADHHAKTFDDLLALGDGRYRLNTPERR